MGWLGQDGRAVCWDDECGLRRIGKGRAGLGGLGLVGGLWWAWTWANLGGLGRAWAGGAQAAVA